MARREGEFSGLASGSLGGAGLPADFERERADRLMTEPLRATADTLAAKEAAAGLDG